MSELKKVHKVHGPTRVAFPNNSNFIVSGGSDGSVALLPTTRWHNGNPIWTTPSTVSSSNKNNNNNTQNPTSGSNAGVTDSQQVLLGMGATNSSSAAAAASSQFAIPGSASGNNSNQGVVTSVAYHPATDRIAYVTRGAEIYQIQKVSTLTDQNVSKRSSRIAKLTGELRQVSFTECGRYLVVAGDAMRILDLDKDNQANKVRTLRVNVPGPYLSFSLSPAVHDSSDSSSSSSSATTTAGGEDQQNQNQNQQQNNQQQQRQEHFPAGLKHEWIALVSASGDIGIVPFERNENESASLRTKQQGQNQNQSQAIDSSQLPNLDPNSQLFLNNQQQQQQGGGATSSAEHNNKPVKKMFAFSSQLPLDLRKDENLIPRVNWCLVPAYEKQDHNVNNNNNKKETTNNHSAEQQQQQQQGGEDAASGDNQKNEEKEEEKEKEKEKDVTPEQLLLTFPSEGGFTVYEMGVRNNKYSVDRVAFVALPFDASLSTKSTVQSTLLFPMSRHKLHAFTLSSCPSAVAGSRFSHLKLDRKKHTAQDYSSNSHWMCQTALTDMAANAANGSFAFGTTSGDVAFLKKFCTASLVEKSKTSSSTTAAAAAAGNPDDASSSATKKKKTGEEEKGEHEEVKNNNTDDDDENTNSSSAEKKSNKKKKKKSNEEKVEGIVTDEDDDALSESSEIARRRRKEEKRREKRKKKNKKGKAGDNDDVSSASSAEESDLDALIDELNQGIQKYIPAGKKRKHRRVGEDYSNSDEDDDEDENEDGDDENNKRKKEEAEKKRRRGLSSAFLLDSDSEDDEVLEQRRKKNAFINDECSEGSEEEEEEDEAEEGFVAQDHSHKFKKDNNKKNNNKRRGGGGVLADDEEDEFYHEGGFAEDEDEYDDDGDDEDYEDDDDFIARESGGGGKRLARRRGRRGAGTGNGLAGFGEDGAEVYYDLLRETANKADDLSDLCEPAFQVGATEIDENGNCYFAFNSIGVIKSGNSDRETVINFHDKSKNPLRINKQGTVCYAALGMFGAAFLIAPNVNSESVATVDSMEIIELKQNIQQFEAKLSNNNNNNSASAAATTGAGDSSSVVGGHPLEAIEEMTKRLESLQRTQTIRKRAEVLQTARRSTQFELFFRSFQAFGGQPDWSMQISTETEGRVRSLAVGRRYVALFTSKYMRIFSACGWENAVVRLPHTVITATGQNTSKSDKLNAMGTDLLMYVFQEQRFAPLKLRVVNVESQSEVQAPVDLPLTCAAPKTRLAWTGWSDEGNIFAADVDGNVFSHISDWFGNSHSSSSSSSHSVGGSFQPVYEPVRDSEVAAAQKVPWVWHVAEEKIWYIPCDRRNISSSNSNSCFALVAQPSVGPDLPTPETRPLRVAALGQGVLQTETYILRQFYLRTYARANKLKKQSEFYTAEIASLDADLDRVLLKLFKTELANERTSKAIDLATNFQLRDSLEVAARHSHEAQNSYVTEKLLQILQFRIKQKKKRLCDLPAEGSMVSAKERDKQLRRLLAKEKENEQLLQNQHPPHQNQNQQQQQQHSQLNSSAAVSSLPLTLNTSPSKFSSSSSNQNQNQQQQRTSSGAQSQQQQQQHSRSGVAITQGVVHAAPSPVAPPHSNNNNNNNSKQQQQQQQPSPAPSASSASGTGTKPTNFFNRMNNSNSTKPSTTTSAAPTTTTTTSGFASAGNANKKTKWTEVNNKKNTSTTTTASAAPKGSSPSTSASSASASKSNSASKDVENKPPTTTASTVTKPTATASLQVSPGSASSPAAGGNNSASKVVVDAAPAPSPAPVPEVVVRKVVVAAPPQSAQEKQAAQASMHAALAKMNEDEDED